LTDQIELLSGWGRSMKTAAHTYHPDTVEDAGRVLAGASRRGVIGRGLGRSYGDAAQNAGGKVISTVGLDRILAIDGEKRTARVEAGVSLDRLIRAALPLGLWPAVTPGTRQVTIGGAIASDVHGKNHHRDGTFSAHVDSLVIATPVGDTVNASPTPEPFEGLAPQAGGTPRHVPSAPGVAGRARSPRPATPLAFGPVPAALDALRRWRLPVREESRAGRPKMSDGRMILRLSQYLPTSHFVIMGPAVKSTAGHSGRGGRPGRR
jgi:hypothetical protein